MINECNIYVYYDFIIIHNRVIIPIFVCGTFGENLVLGLLKMAKKSVEGDKARNATKFLFLIYNSNVLSPYTSINRII